MSIPSRFRAYIHEQALCQPGDRILLAVSGGKDSVMMARLFADLDYTLGIAHCNFGLRGDESDADEQLVYELSKALDVPFYVTRFDTRSYAQQMGISTQMAARELRYDWFETVRASQGYDYVAVAHHRNDHVETLMLNLVRGTGLAGLQGIHPKRGNLIRPMLFLEAAEIAAYVQQRGWEFRDDLSNFSTKYARNKIRLEVIPKLKELNPDLERTVAKSMGYFADAYAVVQRYVGGLREQLFTRHDGEQWHIPIDRLASLDPRPLLLYELFKPFGFTETTISDLIRALAVRVPGKRFSSPTHTLYIDRQEVVLTVDADIRDTTMVLEKPGASAVWKGYRFQSFLSTETTIDPDPCVAQFDADRLVFPLSVRSWREGDMLRPLGMKGHKKVSDLFVSLKIPVYRKHNVPVVVNGNGDILWVAPYRMDDRYKITDKTKKVLTLACS